MNQIIENAVQAEARRCSDAIKSAMKARPRPKFDSVSKPLLSKHYAKVKPLGVSFIKFVSVIGRLNGRFGAES
ncbi:TPA: hypothetical protein HIQ17_002836 [Escherichia coli]|uniref:hypothetical protein n=1 Tax=Escherichia coli TaxID=562 RepID=UPI000F5F1C2A|nr:hypothetical protein [Escherichia coli]MCG9396555.1 hypothetical protein [Escherichia coli]RRB96074.1 hypothetical protein EIA20_01920 [Escherichia coli]HAH9343264.1 hypothetical protein [Escherichia coli]HBB0332016.1 hypothetical protein [Escherichia coli]